MEDFSLCIAEEESKMINISDFSQSKFYSRFHRTVCCPPEVLPDRIPGYVPCDVEMLWRKCYFLVSKVELKKNMKTKLEKVLEIEEEAKQPKYSQYF